MEKAIPPSRRKDNNDKARRRTVGVMGKPTERGTGLMATRPRSRRPGYPAADASAYPCRPPLRNTPPTSDAPIVVVVDGAPSCASQCTQVCSFVCETQHFILFLLGRGSRSLLLIGLPEKDAKIEPVLRVVLVPVAKTTFVTFVKLYCTVRRATSTVRRDFVHTMSDDA